MAEDKIVIKLICKNLPGIRFEDPHPGQPLVREPVYLGIQVGEEVFETVPANRRQVTFIPSFRIGTRNDGSPNFLGPFAHGTPTERFIYLSWGVRKSEGKFEMFRRAKIHLSHLTWKEIKKSINSKKPITAELSLTDAKGNPLCASVKEPHIRWIL